MENGGSRMITHSQVLPGLAISLSEEAFGRTRQMNHGKVSAWLLSQFKQQTLRSPLRRSLPLIFSSLIPIL